MQQFWLCCVLLVHLHQHLHLHRHLHQPQPQHQLQPLHQHQLRLLHLLRFQQPLQHLPQHITTTTQQHPPQYYPMYPAYNFGCAGDCRDENEVCEYPFPHETEDSCGPKKKCCSF
ncbi:hypothetical protein KUTeg_002702 [Tegillarca granosa]|uniref:WAP domain-containing protein n=1 Tax=Tegillarca granosa TaxID=220873 RepID=A0ABQ9FXX9_TEGGR|nr:hypothetical protein KUTeg_002702 [Tegillarca granosa]